MPNDRVFISGGESDASALTELVGETLVGKAPMTYKRSSHSICTVSDNLLMVSGSTDNPKKCEIYNIEKDSWEEIQELNEPRC